jgi:hypothetical protein
MGTQSTFFRNYATPLKVNGAFLAVIILSFTMLILSFEGRERYGWVYPLLSALVIIIVALSTNIFLAIIMAGKDQRNMVIAYSIAVVPYLLMFLFFWSIAGQMHIGKLEGG